ncbi:MAG: FAD-dependent oxidoreductase [Parasphingorhabdus sp.]|nr:FAD-dependent oxidoreductase [Parasphingorhabdus sp.]
MFVQIGLLPNTDWLKGTVELTRDGEIVVDERGGTQSSGVFAAGDADHRPYKQIVIASGDGAKAALGAFDYLIRAACPRPEQRGLSPAARRRWPRGDLAPPGTDPDEAARTRPPSRPTTAPFCRDSIDHATTPAPTWKGCSTWIDSSSPARAARRGERLQSRQALRGDRRPRERGTTRAMRPRPTRRRRPAIVRP